MVVVAQLVRAPDCGSGGRRFETDLPPLNNKGFRNETLFIWYNTWHKFKTYNFHISSKDNKPSSADLSSICFLFQLYWYDLILSNKKEFYI